MHVPQCRVQPFVEKEIIKNRGSSTTSLYISHLSLSLIHDKIKYLSPILFGSYCN